MKTDKQNIRKTILNKCFRSTKPHTIRELIEKCNSVLSNQNEKISRSTLYNDIEYFENVLNVKFKRTKVGKETAYQYENPSFSIFSNDILSEEEVTFLREALNFFSTVEGLPTLDLINKILIKLEKKQYLATDHTEIISYESNPDYMGLSEFFEELYIAIINKQVLKIEYLPFDKPNSKIYEFHPRYLKEYTNRWFVLGHVDKFNNPTIFALDRIISIEISTIKFESIDFDWKLYFENRLGVSYGKGLEEDILLSFTPRKINYVKTKPIHLSQKIDISTCEVRLNLVPNNELEAKILSFGDDVEIKSPIWLRDVIKEKLQNALKKYG